MSEKNEEAIGGAAVATFAGSAFKKRKKKKKKRKNPLALAKSGIRTPVGYEDTTNGDMSQFGGNPPYGRRRRKVRRKKTRLEIAIEEAVDKFFEGRDHPGAGRKHASKKEMRGFKKKKGVLGIPRQRMK